MNTVEAAREPGESAPKQGALWTARLPAVSDSQSLTFLSPDPEIHMGEGEEKSVWDFPGDPVVKNPSISGAGRSHMPEGN